MNLLQHEWMVDVVDRLPQAVISRAWGWVARRRKPRFAIRVLKKAFVNFSGINMNEAQQGMDEYETLEDLFIRKLRAGVRRVEPDPTALVSPVDGGVLLASTRCQAPLRRRQRTRRRELAGRAPHAL